MRALRKRTLAFPPVPPWLIEPIPGIPAGAALGVGSVPMYGPGTLPPVWKRRPTRPPPLNPGKRLAVIPGRVYEEIHCGPFHLPRDEVPQYRFNISITTCPLAPSPGFAQIVK